MLGYQTCAKYSCSQLFDKRDRQQKLLTIFGCENNLIFDELLAEKCYWLRISFEFAWCQKKKKTNNILHIFTPADWVGQWELFIKRTRVEIGTWFTDAAGPLTLTRNITFGIWMRFTIRIAIQVSCSHNTHQIQT